MKIIILLISVNLLNLSCGSFDVSNNPKYNYGFKVNYLYQTQKNLYFRKQFRQGEPFTIMKIREIDKLSLSQERILPSGTKFKITDLSYNNKSGLIRSSGIILDGKFKGRKIKTTFLTKEKNGKSAYLDEDLVMEIGKE